MHKALLAASLARAAKRLDAGESRAGAGPRFPPGGQEASIEGTSGESRKTAEG